MICELLLVCTLTAAECPRGPVEDIAFIMQLEGADADHPLDPGGKTRYGISARAFPDIDIEKLTVEQAAKLYKIDYWDKVQPWMMPRDVGLVMFDTAVLHGTTGAYRLLRWMVWAHTRECRLDSVRELQDWAWELPQLAESLLHAREAVLMNSDDKTWAAFGEGWMNRLAAVRRELLK